MADKPDKSAEEVPTPEVPEGGGKAKKSPMKMILMAVIVLALLGVAGGGGFMAAKMMGGGGGETADAGHGEEVAEEEGGGHGAEPEESGGGGHGAPAKESGGHGAPAKESGGGGHGGGGGGGEEVDDGMTRFYVDLDPIITNLRDPQSRYALEARIWVEAGSREDMTYLENSVPVLMDVGLSLLGSKSRDEIQMPGNEELLREELKNVFAQEVGPGYIVNVGFKHKRVKRNF